MKDAIIPRMSSQHKFCYKLERMEFKDDNSLTKHISCNKWLNSNFTKIQDTEGISHKYFIESIIKNDPKVLGT